MAHGSRTRTWAIAIAIVVTACDTPPSVDSIDPPTVEATEPRTRMNPVELSGSGEPGLTVQVRGGAAIAEADVDASGAWTAMVMLNADAANTLLISQTDGTEESSAVSRTITHDGTAPSTPVLDALVSPTRQPNARVRGMTEASAVVLVTGGLSDAMATADATGRFEVTVPLMTSATAAIENTLAIRARDDVGNESGVTMAEITFDPTIAVEAPLVDAIAPTNDVMVDVTGTAEMGVTITIAGAASPASGTAGSDGSFSIPVELTPNTSNTLFVFAVAGSETSAAATLVVIHDDIAPTSPALDPVASPTSLDTVSIGGSTEASATISVSGGAAPAAGDADADGRFGVLVDLTADSENMLEVVATDVAGNASEPAMVTLTHDSSLPTPVVVNAVPSPTSDNPITLSGTTEAGATVQIVGGPSMVEVDADAAGAFMAEVMLFANASNELHVRRAGSGADTILVVVHDGVAPDAPTVNSIPSPTGSTSLVVTGTSEPFVRLSVTGGTSSVTGTAGETGAFSLPVQITADDESTLSVIATDRAGNSSTPTTLDITHSSSTPAAPIVDVAAPLPTSNATYRLTGRVPSPAAGVTVMITGGASAASGPTNPSTGVFGIDVTLDENAVNTLDVVSMAGAITSAPARVTVVHDDIAPDAPDAELMDADGTGLCLLRASTGVTGTAGAVEARAIVHVTNGDTSASVTTSADDGGGFSVNIVACAGDTLSVTATDAAGNTSDPTTFDVR
jgi:large repetitive protein